VSGPILGDAVPPAANARVPPVAPRGAGQPRREFGLTLAVGVAGAGIMLLAVAQPWARASFAPAPPLPASRVAVSGHELAPAADALGLAALASLAAVIASRGAARRVSGLLLALLGLLIAVTAATAVRHVHVAAAAAAHGLATAGVPRVALAVFPWWVVAAAGGLAAAAAGVLTAWRGTRWPAMSSKYDRPGGPPRSAGDPATAWDVLDRGGDPTVPDA